MKRAWFIGLVLAFVAGSASAADLKEVEASGTLRVLAVVDEREPQFMSLRSGPAAGGFDMEILQAFAKAHRLEVKVVPVAGWDGLVPALLERKGDLVAGRFTATPERRKRVTFTDEVFPSRTVMVTRRPHPPVLEVAGLAAEKVGTVRGTSMVEALTAAGVPLGRIDLSLTTGMLGEGLRSGKITVAIWELEGAMLAQRGDPELELGGFVGPPESLAYATRNEDAELRRALNDHLRTTRQTGNWNRLAVKYFGQSAPEILRKAREQ